MCFSVAPRLLYPLYQLKRRLGGPQNQSGRLGETANLITAELVCFGGLFLLKPSTCDVTAGAY